MASDRINVIGWYDKRNCGDESYKTAFGKVFPNNDFTFSEIVLEGYAKYIIGGGDVLTQGLLEKMTKIDRPKYLMSISVSKLFKEDSFSGFERIIVRDNMSIKNLQESGIKADLFPDFAFALEPRQSRGEALIAELFGREKHDLYNKKIAIVINSHLIPTQSSPHYEQCRFDRLCADLAITLDQVPASFIFLPFGTKAPWDDRVSNGVVASRCKFWKKNVVVYETLEPQDILDIISACTAAISTRLHSSIFSATCSVPFVDILHNHKNSSFLQTIGYENNAIEYGNYSIQKMLELVNSLLVNNETSRQEISRISLAQKQLLGSLRIEL